MRVLAYLFGQRRRRLRLCGVPDPAPLFEGVLSDDHLDAKLLRAADEVAHDLPFCAGADNEVDQDARVEEDSEACQIRLRRQVAAGDEPVEQGADGHESDDVVAERVVWVECGSGDLYDGIPE